MTDLPLVSATQIELWRDCKRKWGFKYLERIITPTHPAALLGTEVQDEQLDPYLVNGREFDFSRPSGEIAQKLAPLLPARGSATLWQEDAPLVGLTLRRKFLAMPSPGDKFAYRGEFDLWAPDSSVVPGFSGGTPLLGDIKTTGNLYYAKTSEKLATDVQAQLYAMAIMYEDNVNELDLVWFYTRTRGARRAERHYLHVYSSHVAEQFQLIDAIATQLVEAKVARPNVNDLPPNARMCEAYGGCPYRNKCQLSPAVFAAAVNQSALEETMSAQTNDFLANLRKTVPSSTPAALAGHVGPAHDPIAELKAKIAELEAAKQPVTEPTAGALPAWATDPVDPMAKPAINPPECVLPPAPPVEAKKRGRPAKAAVPAASGDALPAETKKDPNLGITKLDGFTSPESTFIGNGPAAIPVTELTALVASMRSLGVKRLAMNAGQIYEVELFEGTP